ncbi:hypothetical protein KP007_03685 [Raoultella ornithinolytica]|nr:hypothetical protein FNV36_18695 [Raoultella ornithinolytica]KAB8166240.1 hypothetical protein FNV35_18550 [Raoultella ornithinolytica]QWU12692.1 hypothetical protein KP007_03685 [Raoultella ornithinolytica]HCI9483945.1 hypothetical protein [Raoultella ornithinolytica]
MGLPASGKTTFLAALWHLVESNETTCRLELDAYDGDLTYLNRIAEAWRNFEPVPRTSQIGDMNVAIHLRNRETGEKGTAFFPDLAGETFDRQVEDRIFRKDFMKGFSEDDGILFFISSDVREDFISVTELNARLPSDSEIDESLNDTPAEMRITEWEPKLLPAQVKIVQLLSDIIRPPFEPRLRRIALLISAWDLVHRSGVTPYDWLEVNMPLVAQFLKANKDYFEHQIYGVSAQGVNLNDDTAVDEVANLLASRRIKIVGMESEGNDLTEPLIWLMSAGK